MLIYQLMEISPDAAVDDVHIYDTVDATIVFTDVEA